MSGQEGGGDGKGSGDTTAAQKAKKPEAPKKAVSGTEITEKLEELMSDDTIGL